MKVTNEVLLFLRRSKEKLASALPEMEEIAKLLPDFEKIGENLTFLKGLLSSGESLFRARTHIHTHSDKKQLQLYKTYHSLRWNPLAGTCLVTAAESL